MPSLCAHAEDSVEKAEAEQAFPDGDCGEEDRQIPSDPGELSEVTIGHQCTAQNDPGRPIQGADILFSQFKHPGLAFPFPWGTYTKLLGRQHRSSPTASPLKTSDSPRSTEPPDRSRQKYDWPL